MQTPKNIYGVDFSGSKNAGKWIWIAKGVIENENLVIEACFRGRDLPGSGNGLEICLSALRNFIKKHSDAAFGMDFPFALPKELVEQDRWKDFILKFPSLYSSPEGFRDKCFSKAGRRELKRNTDIKSKAPFSPYNLRLHKQTYFGISEIIAPLVREDLALFLPMQKPKPGRPLVLEVCPASTLKNLGLYEKYKFKKNRDDCPETRSKILKEIERQGPLKFQGKGIRGLVVQDRNGDALDSVIAAFAAYRAMKKGLLPKNEKKEYRMEGYVYV
ncbi:MAG: DUF429 domain-containing protein [Candidatus Thorarchaeota archaeon]